MVPHSLLLGPGLLFLLGASRHVCGNISRRGGISSSHAPRTWKAKKTKNKKQKPITFIYVSGMGRGHGDCCVSWVEVRGQFLATSSSLPPCGYGGLNSRWWTALVTGAFTYWAILQSPPLFRLLARHSPTAECPPVQWDQPMLQVRIRSFSMSCWQPRCLWLTPVFSDGLCSGWRLTCWLWAPLQAKEALEITTVFRRLMENYSLLSRVQKAN